ncbi:MAG TPA: esterase-like activity of phytase family protein [Burkholderiales bacterium]
MHKPRRAPPARLRFGRRAALLALLLLSPALVPAVEPPRALETELAPLAENLPVGAQTGRMRFLGMLALRNGSADGMRVSQLSGLAWDEDEQLLYALSDKGALVHLRPVLRNGVLRDVDLVRIVPLRELGTDKVLRDRRLDAEGLAALNADNGRRGDTELLVSFERYPRIMRYRPDGHALGEYRLPPALAERDRYAGANRMLESVCHDDRFGVLTAPEKPLEGTTARIFSLASKSWHYPIDPQDRIVGLECLGGGEVLVLEGNFGAHFWRAHTTLKRVRLGDEDGIPALRPELLFSLQSSQGYQIDNFEGIARHRGNRFFLVSDDNDFFLQRTLLMYFELLDPPVQ